MLDVKAALTDLGFINSGSRANIQFVGGRCLPGLFAPQVTDHFAHEQNGTAYIARRDHTFSRGVDDAHYRDAGSRKAPFQAESSVEVAPIYRGRELTRNMRAMKRSITQQAY